MLMSATAEVMGHAERWAVVIDPVGRRVACQPPFPDRRTRSLRWFLAMGACFLVLHSHPAGGR
jgi:hypothetical protein